MQGGSEVHETPRTVILANHRQVALMRPESSVRGWKQSKALSQCQCYLSCTFVYVVGARNKMKPEIRRPIRALTKVIRQYEGEANFKRY